MKITRQGVRDLNTKQTNGKVKLLLPPGQMTEEELSLINEDDIQEIDDSYDRFCDKQEKKWLSTRPY